MPLPVSRCAPEDAILLQARATALRYAFRFGMTPEDAQDCASDFVLVVLQAQDTSSATASLLPSNLPAPDAERYLATCAHNFAFHRCRKLAQRRRREQALLPSDEMPGGIGAGVSSAAPRPALPQGKIVPPLGIALQTRSAEAQALAHLEQGDFWEHLFQAVAVLSSAQRHVFIRFYLEEETLSRIAERTGQKELSAKQTLHRARLRVRSRLPQPSQKIVKDF